MGTTLTGNTGRDELVAMAEQIGIEPGKLIERGPDIHFELGSGALARALAAGAVSVCEREWTLRTSRQPGIIMVAMKQGYTDETNTSASSQTQETAAAAAAAGSQTEAKTQAEAKTAGPAETPAGGIVERVAAEDAIARRGGIASKVGKRSRRDPG
jgi:hypothetical protein